MYFFIALLTSSISFLLQGAVTRHNLMLLHHSLAQLQIKLPPASHTPPSAPSTSSSSSSSSTLAEEDGNAFASSILATLNHPLYVALTTLTRQLNTLFPTPELIKKIEDKEEEAYDIAQITSWNPTLKDKYKEFGMLYETKLELLKHRLDYTVNNEDTKKLLQKAWLDKLAVPVPLGSHPRDSSDLALENLDRLKHIFTIVYPNDLLPAQEKEQLKKARETLYNAQKTHYIKSNNDVLKWVEGVLNK